MYLFTISAKVRICSTYCLWQGYGSECGQTRFSDQKGSTSKLMPNGVKVNDATGELIVAVVDGVTSSNGTSKTRSLFIWKSC